MKVKQIAASSFMGYESVSVTLPDAGLVLVTGQNGAGKSALVEAIAYATWGKTLRGTDPRRLGEAGSVTVVSDQLEVTREWSEKHRTSLTVAKAEHTPWEFENVTKAQEHVAGVVGEWDTWRRSCVFSSVDTDGFTTAPDADRKRLLEDLLGLQQFDRASVAARDALRQAERGVADTTRSVELLTQVSAAARTHLDVVQRLAASSPAPTDLEVLRAELASTQAEVATLTADAQAGEALQREWRVQQATFEAERKSLERRRQQVGGMTCTACDRPFDDVAQKVQAKAAIEEELANLQPPPLAPVIQDFSSELLRIQQRGADLRARMNSYVAAEKAYQRAVAAVEVAQDAVIDGEDKLCAAQADLDVATRAASELSAVDKVLGTKGVRAHILATAIAGVEAAANDWLNRVARIDAPLSLKLSPYTEKKAGGTSDSIALEVIGAGGGRGYKATSGGERRRIDVAIMLALAEVSHQANRQASPTLVFDECLDALDTDGVKAVVAAMESLAHDRCVLVVTHSKDLISSLSPVLHLEASGGVLHRR